MTTQCKHTNVRIIEEATGYTTHVWSGDRWLHDSSFGDYTGVVEVTCFDCGFSGRYTPSRMPKWLQKRLDSALKVQP